MNSDRMNAVPAGAFWASIFFVISVSLTTDILLPVFITWLPPVANLVVLLYAIGFIREVAKSNLMSRGQPISSEIILNTVMNPVLLLDSAGRIIRCNKATHE